MTIKSLSPRRVIPTPLHASTLAACQTIDWKTRCGFTVPSVFTCLEDEDRALHETVGMSDISARAQILIAGPDAEAMVNRLVVANVSSLKAGETLATPFCDRQGLVIDIAEIIRIGDDAFRLHTSQPHLPWLLDNCQGLDVSVNELASSAGLSLTGPEAPFVLEAIGSDTFVLPQQGGGGPVQLAGLNNILLTRPMEHTVFTVHIWAEQSDCLALWGRLLGLEGEFGIKPVGERARHILRVEEGRPRLGQDFMAPGEPGVGPGSVSALQLGYGDQLQPDKGYFAGARTLLAQMKTNPEAQLLSLNCADHAVPSGAGLYAAQAGGKLGIATSMCFSPTLQSHIGLCLLSGTGPKEATIEADICAENGQMRSGTRFAVRTQIRGCLLGSE